jgi:hypothetical protein
VEHHRNGQSADNQDESELGDQVNPQSGDDSLICNDDPMDNEDPVDNEDEDDEEEDGTSQAEKDQLR